MSTQHWIYIGNQAWLIFLLTAGYFITDKLYPTRKIWLGFWLYSLCTLIGLRIWLIHIEELENPWWTFVYLYLAVKAVSLSYDHNWLHKIKPDDDAEV